MMSHGMLEDVYVYLLGDVMMGYLTCYIFIDIVIKQEEPMLFRVYN
jgi:hypothetical protein